MKTMYGGGVLDIPQTLTTTNHTVLKIITPEKLEPIVATGICSNTDKGIVTITLIKHTNEIEKIIDEVGTELTLSTVDKNITGVSKSYTTGEHKFYVIDKIENIREISVSVEKKLLTVTYVPNEGTLASTYKIEEGVYGEEVRNGESVSFPTPTLSGYVFDGWYTTSNFQTNTKITTGYTVTNDITLYAKYTEYVMPSLEVGDIVNYDASKGTSQVYTYTTDSSLTGHTTSTTFKSTDAMKWKVLSIDKTAGTVEIIAADDTRLLYLKGLTGFENAESILNNISTVYGHGYGAIGARSVTIEDIEKYSTFDKTTYTNAYSSTKKWGGTRSFASGKFYTETGTKTNGDKIYATTTTTASKSNIITMTQTYYTYSSATNYFTTKIGNMLIKNTKGNDRNYFLASRCVTLGSVLCVFQLRGVFGGSVGADGIYNSNVSVTNLSRAVSPVVTLNSSIQYVKNSSGEWDIN